MKIFNWIQQHKYPIMVTAFFITVAMCLYFFFQGLKKDHTLDMVKQELQLKEQNRQLIIESRKPLLQIIDQQNQQILTLQIRDSLVNTMASQNAIKIQQISTSQYAKQKTAVIDNLSDTDLQHYFNALPEPNDYEAGDVGR